MKQTIPTVCNRCGAATEIVELRGITKGTFSYCKACGWNESRLRDGLARTFDGFYVISAMVILFDIGNLTSRHDSTALINSAAISLPIIALLATVAFRRAASFRRKLQSLPPRAAKESLASTLDWREELEIRERSERIASMKIPRPVRLRQEAQRTRNILLFYPAAMFLWGIHDLIRPGAPLSAVHGGSSARIAGVILMLLSGLTAVFIRRRFEPKREEKLLTQGEVAMARVVEARSAFFEDSGILYEFQDESGQTVRSRDRGTLDEDAHVLVFYDAQDSKNCVAECGSKFELS